MNLFHPAPEAFLFKVKLWRLYIQNTSFNDFLFFFLITLFFLLNVCVMLYVTLGIEVIQLLSFLVLIKKYANIFLK